MEATKILTELVTREQDVVARAIGFHIANQDTFQGASDFLQNIVGLRAEINANFDPSIKSAYQTHRSICAAKREHTTRLDQAEAVIRPKISHYLQEQKREQIRLQRIADEEAKKRAEEDKLEEAEHLDNMGDYAGAGAVLEAPVVALPVAVPPTVQKVEGIHLRETWHYLVESPLDLVKAIAKGKVSIQAIQLNASWMNTHAQRNKVSLPGVKVWRDDSVVAGKGGDK